MDESIMKGVPGWSLQCAIVLFARVTYGCGSILSGGVAIC